MSKFIKKVAKLNIAVLIFQMMMSVGCGRNGSDNITSDHRSSNPNEQTSNKERLEVYIDGVSTSERIKRIRAQNKVLIDAALDKLKEQQRIIVDESVESQCDGTPSKYVISKVNGELNLTLDVKFLPAEGTTDDEFNSGVELVKSCIPEIQDFFLRYDVKFNLITHISDSSTDFKTLHEVKITARKVRSDSGLYSTGNPQFCRMVIHEIGHLMGLADEYAEAGTCRTEEMASKDKYPDSFMDNTKSEFELFPRHLRTMLAAVYDKKELVKGDGVSLEEPKRLTLTLVKDLIPTRKGEGFAEIKLVSVDLGFTGNLAVLSRHRNRVIDVVPAGTRLVFENAKGILVPRRFRKRDGSLDTRTRYIIPFNKGIKTREDIHLRAFYVEYLSHDSKLKGLKEVLKEFGQLN